MSDHSHLADIDAMLTASFHLTPPCKTSICQQIILFLLLIVGLLQAPTASAKFTVATATDLTLSNTSPITLCKQAKITAKYLAQYPTESRRLGIGLPESVTVEDIEATLSLICKIVTEDQYTKGRNRLSDSTFIERYFTVYQWHSNQNQIAQAIAATQRKNQQKRLAAIPDGKILLTKYYIKKAQGSRIPTQHFNQAIYPVPDDEKHLTNEQIEQQKASLTRFKYSRQQIFSGALTDSQLVTPLAWVNEGVMHDILMQGTVVLSIDGIDTIFNVHKNNGRSYQYHLEKHQQTRYWYFKETKNLLGYGIANDDKLVIYPKVTVAADIHHLGLGSLLLLHEPKKALSELVLTGDTGGAFANNHFQLDWLVGYYQGWQDYQQANKHLPPHVDVYLLVSNGHYKHGSNSK